MSRIETPVMLLFFNRPEVLQQTFSWVKQVKPKQLFLVQDGARANRPDDSENILACRRIVEDIDWECDVKKNYTETNMSCDHREFTGIDWCFENVDRLIILEDDCCPVYSFYQFCGEMLQRYEKDERIHMISGFNRCGKYDATPYDYIFSQTGAGYGWATWKRQWDKVKAIQTLDIVNDRKCFDYYESLNADYMKTLHSIFQNTIRIKEKQDEENKIISWEHLMTLTQLLSHSLTITPSINMINYRGISQNATHTYAKPELLVSRVRTVVTQPAFELKFPLKHPPYVVRDRNFENKDYLVFWKRNRILEPLESIFLKVKYGRFDLLIAAVKRRFYKWFM